MTAPRFYSWDDDGSPGRALTGNLQNRLKQILVACLVNGYGSKPGAGWTLEHEHANGFTLSNGDAYVNFVSNLPASAPYPAMSPNAIHIYCAESLMDTSKAIIDGASLCSGTYRKGAPEPGLYARHMLGNASRVFIEELSSLQWTVVADEKTFVINCSSSSSSKGGTERRRYSFTLYCGSAVLDSEVSGNFIALGGSIDAYQYLSDMYAFSRGYSSPRNPLNGISQLALVDTEPYASSYDVLPNIESSPPSQLCLQSPRLMSGGAFAGRLRGVVYDDVLRSKYGWGVALQALGFSGTDFTDRGKQVKIGDYHYAYAQSSSGSSFLTDNPMYW